MIPTIYVPISDDTLWIIPIYYYLFNKYWGREYEVKFLGFRKPDCGLPDNFEFISMASEQGGANYWSWHLAKYFESINDELVIFTLEDFLPVAKPKIIQIEYITNGWHYFGNDYIKVGRFDLTWDLYCNCEYNLMYSDILSVPKAMYRISCQPAIWDRNYLVRILSESTNPWDFEMNGSARSLKYPEKVLGVFDPTFKTYPTKWTPKGAISRHHPDMFNVLGMDMETIKELLDMGLIQRDKLQWGQWQGKVPTFDELGGFNFKPSMLPQHPASPSNWKEWESTYQ